MSDRLDDFFRRGQAAQRAVDAHQQLRLRRGDDGWWRHFIGPVPVHVGQPIAALIDGAWVDGHYEATWFNGLPVAAFHWMPANGGRRSVPLTLHTLVHVRAGARFGSP